MSTEGAPKPEMYNFDNAGFDDYRYATNFVITASGREFFLSFVCARPYERPRCVSRVILGEEHLRELITVLSRQLEKSRMKKRDHDDLGGETKFIR